MTILKVDMSQKNLISEAFPKDVVVGGRGMIAYLMTEYCPPTAHPLSEESIFVLAPGLLGGTAAPQINRISVGGKSPLTGGIKEANSGGTIAFALSRLGLRAVMVSGKADEWQILKITKEGAFLEPAGDIVGLKNYDTCDRLRERYGNKIAVACIGPAGEMGMAAATVAVTDMEGRPSRHCGRGGLGAVMGAKKLKAVVVDDAGGKLRQPARKDEFREAAQQAVKHIKEFLFTPFFHAIGTHGSTQEDSDRGSLPSYNHRSGSFDKVANINHEKYIELVDSRGGVKGHGCMPGCVIKCSTVFNDKDGKFVTAGFEYETVGLLGSNLGIDDLDEITRMERKCDDYGVDTIEVGATIGILNDVGLFEFGDSVKAKDYIDEIGKGSPMGRILGSGSLATGKAYGIDRIPAVKGQAIPAHAARSLKGWGVTYATSPMGGDHTAGLVADDPLSPVGQVERSRNAQIFHAALDSAGFCMFTFMPPVIAAALISSFYGVDWTADDYLEMGKEVLRKERAFNINAGISKEADGLPDWMTKEPLPPTNAVWDVPREEYMNLFNF
ncbi:MAG: aldehyde ferredoxin oxidoreductase C-terminal domain-containing protein [Desulfobacterales bacterium]|nr:aldehyde ferredoxin oxidoreductase C-terminal domain-containing protein [Desulfobacterales bacterium]MDD4072433.1 aldehyde ferredoxin oxidoreductase C-terminal domain-containing protein [Desulfobacterales bacterium]MDD4392737.1 aldehyde ferredoxin oxidoreductase C-terminal domain-containing protein [Desulfobacterales bacterium]